MKQILSILLAFSICACNQKSKKSDIKLASAEIKDSTRVSGKDSVTSHAAVSKANDTIMPGKSIGHISLDEKTEDVIQALGQPDSSDAAMGKQMLSWYSKPTKKDTAVNSIKIFAAANFGGKDEAARVRQVRITSPFFKTAEGIGCGSTIAFIKTQYKDIKKASASYTDRSGNPVMIYDDIKEGIAFEIGSNTKCVGVTVHPRGHKAWEIYAAEFGDLDAQ